MSPLGALVGDVGGFARDVWGRRPHRWPRTHASPVPTTHDRGDGQREDGAAGLVPFSLADVDRIIASAVRVPAIRLVRGGERIDPARFCSPTRIGNETLRDVADVRKVLDEYRHGATIVLQALQRTWSPLSAWCADLEAELGWPVQCNAYLSPPHTEGLSRHTDGHDVFALQLYGVKHWDVAGLGDVALGEGDVLYVPAGAEHVAGTRDEASLHLTVGVHRPDRGRVARAALAVALDAADRSAPSAPVPVRVGSATSLTDAVRHATSIARAQLDDVDPDAVARRLRRRPRAHLGGLIEASVRRRPLHDDTAIALAPGVALQVRRNGSTVCCDWSAGTLHVPVAAAEALEAIATADGARPMTVGRLPGLDAEDRLVLVRRLADEGVVVTTDPPTHT